MLGLFFRQKVSSLNKYFKAFYSQTKTSARTSIFFMSLPWKENFYQKFCRNGDFAGKDLSSEHRWTRFKNLRIYLAAPRVTANHTGGLLIFFFCIPVRPSLSLLFATYTIWIICSGEALSWSSQRQQGEQFTWRFRDVTYKSSWTVRSRSNRGLAAFWQQRVPEERTTAIVPAIKMWKQS